MCDDETRPPEILPTQIFEARLKGNEIVERFLKQQVGLAGAAGVLSVTFVGDIFGSEADVVYQPLLFVSWILFLIAVVTGARCSMLLVENLDKPDETPGSKEIFGCERPKAFAAGADPDISRLSAICFVSTIAGLVALAMFAALNFPIAFQSKSNGLEDSQAIEERLNAIRSDIESISAVLESLVTLDRARNEEISEIQRSLAAASDQVAKSLDKVISSTEQVPSAIHGVRREVEELSTIVASIPGAIEVDPGVSEQLARIIGIVEEMGSERPVVIPEPVPCESKSWGIGSTRTVCSPRNQ